MECTRGIYIHIYFKQNLRNSLLFFLLQILASYLLQKIDLTSWSSLKMGTVMFSPSLLLLCMKTNIKCVKLKTYLLSQVCLKDFLFKFPCPAENFITWKRERLFASEKLNLFQCAFIYSCFKEPECSIKLEGCERTAMLFTRYRVVNLTPFSH